MTAVSGLGTRARRPPSPRRRIRTAFGPTPCRARSSSSVCSATFSRLVMPARPSAAAAGRPTAGSPMVRAAAVLGPRSATSRFGAAASHALQQEPVEQPDVEARQRQADPDGRPHRARRARPPGSRRRSTRRQPSARGSARAARPSTRRRSSSRGPRRPPSRSGCLPPPPGGRARPCGPEPRAPFAQASGAHRPPRVGGRRPRCEGRFLSYPGTILCLRLRGG